LILYGTYALGWSHVTPNDRREEYEALITLTRQGWGRNNPAYRQIFTSSFVPEAKPEQAAWFNEMQKVSSSAENAARFLEEFGRIDVRELLPQVTTPTLVLHARNDQRCPFELGRRLAAEIPNARFVPLEGANHIMLEADPGWAQFLAEVRRFLGVAEPQPVESDAPTPQGLVTILFTDVEGSTALTQRLGDTRARDLLRQHERTVREALAAHGGSEVKTMGDGFMASFSSATRAIECATAMQRAFEEHNASAPEPIRVRVGLNAGEPIAEEDDLFGTAVIAAARIAAKAEGGEILASDVVRQLVAGKGFLFADRGEAALRGFDDPVHIYELRWRDEA
jgi:class 3 adenylate cyclase